MGNMGGNSHGALPAYSVVVVFVPADMSVAPE